MHEKKTQRCTYATKRIIHQVKENKSLLVVKIRPTLINVFLMSESLFLNLH